MSDTLVIESRSAADTLRIGEALGRVLRGSDFIALSGPLGAGKTAFVKGLARGLGVAENEPIVSPTFVLAREYIGRLRLYHLDAYRLTDETELLEIGFEELLAASEAVVALEWPERVERLIPANACRIEIDYRDAPESRDLRITFADDAHVSEFLWSLRALLAAN